MSENFNSVSKEEMFKNFVQIWVVVADTDQVTRYLSKRPCFSRGVFIFTF